MPDEDQLATKIKTSENPKRQELPELEGLMEDSVISLANLSNFMSPREQSVQQEAQLSSSKKRELEILKEFEEFKAA